MSDRLQKSQLRKKSPLQEAWPPKWFFSYSDLATLLMTFFVIMATMLSLRVPLYVFADPKVQLFMKQQEENKMREIRELTERDKAMLTRIEKLDLEQVKRVVTLTKVRDFANALKEYLEKRNLAEMVVVEDTNYAIRITPPAPFLFVRGKAALRPDARLFLDVIGEFANMYPSDIKIEGYTDSTPVSNRYFRSNWELSVARANSVMRYLADYHHLPYEMLEAIGYGEYHPAAPNDTEENRAKNRRVVITINPRMTEEEAVSALPVSPQNEPAATETLAVPSPGLINS